MQRNPCQESVGLQPKQRLKRTYFYKDKDGSSKKCYYCTFCGAGPFIESQAMDGVFFIRGAGRQPTISCRKCDITRYPMFERVKLTGEGSPMTDIKPADFKEVVPAITPMVTEPVEEPASSPVTEPVDTVEEAKPAITDALTDGVFSGQTWKDKDKRRKRLVTIVRVADGMAYYIGGKGGKTEKSITTKRLTERFKLKV